MKRRQKGYWSKHKESFASRNKAKLRAAALRLHEHTAHVILDRDGEGYVVRYSAAKWWLEEMSKAGISI